MKPFPKRPSSSPLFLAAIQELVEVDSRQLLASALGSLAKAFACDTAALLDLDPATSSLRIYASFGISAFVEAQHRWGLGQGVVGKAAEEEILTRLSEDLQPLLPELIDELAVPLIRDRRVLGVLHLGWHRDGVPAIGTPADGESRGDRIAQSKLAPIELDDELRSSLSLAALVLGQTRHGNELATHLDERSTQLALLTEAGHQLTTILDRNQLLEKIAELVRRWVDFQLFNVFLWNEESQSLAPRFTIENGEIRNLDLDLALGEGICGTVAALRRPIRIGNAASDSRFLSCTTDKETRSELAVPLLIGDRLIGVLNLESYLLEAFTQEHELLLSTLANSVAIALENARLYTCINHQEQRFARDLETARHIQRHLLPQKTPYIEGIQLAAVWESARHLGGDFYDFFRQDQHRLSLLIGDVAGKGTGAALYGALAQGLARALTNGSACPTVCVLEQLDGELRELAVERRFLAMIVADLDVEHRILEIAGAGLPRPLHYRQTDHIVREIPADGLPLGTLSGAKRETSTTEVESGDVIVFYTDGISEAIDIRGVAFGEGRLAEAVLELALDCDARQIAEGILAAADRHGGKEAMDDRTVLVLKITR